MVVGLGFAGQTLGPNTRSKHWGRTLGPSPPAVRPLSPPPLRPLAPPWQAEQLQAVPLCLALTKADLPATLSRAELDLVLGLDELEVRYMLYSRRYGGGGEQGRRRTGRGWDCSGGV